MNDRVTRRAFLGTGAVAGLAAAGSVAADDDASDASDKLKVIGICCSPRKGRTTATALAECLKAAEAVSPRVSTELIELAGMKIPGQVAAGVRLDEGEKDDFPSLVPKLKAPAVAGIIIGTPVYFGNMSYLCKAFLDRCIVFWKDNHALRDKVAGVLAVGGGRNGGQELVVRSVQVSLMAQQMLVVGDAPPTGHWGGTVWAGAGDEVTDDKFGMQTVANLGKNVAEKAMMLRK
ncbi:MAG: flavodoxin family protein [Rhodospirillales bacterium]|nr:flavodoxin family protein [Rhodospirillales bacterium]